jgi:membrane protease YdiL (CAAX protease family)
MTPDSPKPDRVAIGLRVFVYVFLVAAGMVIFPVVLYWAAPVPFVVATLSSFSAAAVANAVTLRIWAHGQLADIGMQWTPASRWNLLLGFAGGVGGGVIASLAPVVLRLSWLERPPGSTVQWGSLVFVSLLLLFGAVGEEMLFRGYAFQFLIGRMGPYATILPFGVLFGLMHGNNPNQTWLGLLNTMAWGVLFGYAFLRSGDLWLPIGLHFGWNWVLPLFGANLSGYTMGVTGLLERSNSSPWWTGGGYGPEGGVFTTMVVAGLFVYLRRTPVQRQRSALARLPEEIES